jgi:ABC-type iron transport system FetAB permease component
MDATPGDTTNLTWVNVGLGLAFIFFNATISSALNLGVGSSLVTSAFRCIVQLAIMGLVLQRIFETNNPWAVGGIAFVLNFLGTFEAVANKSKKRYHNMFSSVLMSMLGSTIPVSIIGARFAMSVHPFWTPEQYIPMVGMLCGNTVSGVVVAVAYVLKEI